MPDAAHDGFGSQLRRLRKLHDFTQEALAQQVGCVVDTIKKIEAGRRRPSRELAALLADTFNLSPAERTDFIRTARIPPGFAPLPASLPAGLAVTGAPLRSSVLPNPLTPLVGRTWELANLTTLVHRDAARLVTLLGPGGAGKTRLALAIAHASVGQFAEGVAFVSLAPLAGAAQVAPAIAQALGLREMHGIPLAVQLQEYLAPRRMLLVLDNVEHLLAAAPLIGDLLAAAPRLTILTTSRSALRIAGEHVFPVLPLAVPAHDQVPSLERLDQYAAIQLFVLCAQAVRPGFALTAENAPLVVAICRQLDGLPLAIELAVARMRLFSLPDLLNRLRQPFALLTDGPRDAPARHQALYATVRWSYQLLSPSEQRCFAHLAVFAGGCTAALAEAVCTDPAQPAETTPSLIDTLSALIDQSLLQSVEGPDGSVRLVLLETIRSYALERLQAAGAEAVLRTRHAEAFLQLAEATLPHLYGPAQIDALHRLESERANCNAALAWWRTHSPEQALQLAGALWPFWDLRGYFSEGRAWLEALLPLAPHAPPAVRARALHGAGSLASFQHDHDTAQAWLAASLALYEALDQPARVAHVRCSLGLSAWFRGNHAEAEALLTASAAAARGAGSVWETADALHFLGHVVFDGGNSARAEVMFRESLELFRRTGDQRNIALPLKDLGLIASQRGEYAAALPLYQQSLVASRAVEDTWHIADTLLRLGDLARLRGDLAQAQALYQEALAGWQRAGARGGIAETLNLLGQIALGQRNLSAAQTYFSQALDLQRAIGSLRVVAGLLYSMGQVAWFADDRARAAAYYRESLDLNAQDGYLPGIGDCLVGFAELAADTNPMRAARLLGASDTLREQSRGFMPLADQTGVARIIAVLGALLPPARLAASCAEGRAMPLEAAIAYAREPVSATYAAPAQVPPASGQIAALHQAGLTAREVDVLLLVAQGLTDQQVAEQLIISIRTVQSHLRSIYGKLGCTTRTAAAHIARTLTEAS